MIAFCIVVKINDSAFNECGHEVAECRVKFSMMRRRFTYKEIGRSVITLDSVDVVYAFAFTNRSAKHFFSYSGVFKNNSPAV